MRRFVSRVHENEETSAIDVTPMLDVVFILLIFFIVTATFVKETGVDVNRPEATTAVVQAAGNILVRDGVAVAVIDFGNMAVGDPACDLALAWATFRAPERAAFRAALPLDADTWARGRAWALWKALITRVALEAGDPTAEADRVLVEVLSEPV